MLAACSFSHGTLPPADSSAPADELTIDTPRPDAAVSLVIEAEAPANETSLDTHYWAVETSEPGFTGTGYVTALPHDFQQCLDPTNNPCGAYNTYAITIPVAGRYRVTVHHLARDSATDSVWWDFGGTTMFDDLDPDMPTTWLDDSTPSWVMLPAGPLTFGLRMRETGARVDSIRLDLD